MEVVCHECNTEGKASVTEKKTSHLFYMGPKRNWSLEHIYYVNLFFMQACDKVGWGLCSFVVSITEQLCPAMLAVCRLHMRSRLFLSHRSRAVRDQFSKLCGCFRLTS